MVLCATFFALFCAAVFFGATACTRGEPPRYTDAIDSVEPIPTAPVRDADEPDTMADAGVDPATLPQTRDMPAPTGAVELRAAALWDAIVKDEPELAMPFFFPRGAYEQTKAITNPAADWKHRLVSNYVRDVHALHKKLGTKADKARFVGLEVPTENAQWVPPGDEGNKTGYYRVYGARLRYELDTFSRSFDVSSMISWRGEWYVVHLTGFK
jgi:hypothetical protein